MRVVKAFPPIYAEILAAFPEAAHRKPIFAWGDIIYNPHGIEVTRELQVHEKVHGDRQLGTAVNGTARGEDAIRVWWHRYLTNPGFRLMEELLAHAAEYRAWCESSKITRNQRRLVLRSLAQRCASPLYGSLISVNDAKIAIAEPGKPFKTRIVGSTSAA